jgi:hypothetical protein
MEVTEWLRTFIQICFWPKECPGKSYQTEIVFNKMRFWLHDQANHFKPKYLVWAQRVPWQSISIKPKSRFSKTGFWPHHTRVRDVNWHNVAWTFHCLLTFLFAGSRLWPRNGIDSFPPSSSTSLYLTCDVPLFASRVEDPMNCRQETSTDG